MPVEAAPATIETPVPPSVESSTSDSLVSADTPPAGEGPKGLPKVESAEDKARQEEADKALDAMLDRAGIVDDEPAKADKPDVEVEEPDAAADTRDRDEHGRFKPKDDPRLSPEWAKAQAALHRDALPKDMIASLAKDPDRFLEYGLKRAKVQADVDAYSAQHGVKQPAAAPQANAPAQAVPEIDWTPVIQPTVDYFSEQFGVEDAGKPLAAMVNGLTQRLSEGVEHLIASRVEPQVHGVMRVLQNLLLNQARSGLTERFPELKDAETFKAVQGRVKQLLSAPDSEFANDLDFSRVLEQAAAVELAPVVEKRLAQQRKAAARSRDLGTPSAPAAQGDTHREIANMTVEQLNDAALDARIDNRKEDAERFESERRRRLAS